MTSTDSARPQTNAAPDNPVSEDAELQPGTKERALAPIWGEYEMQGAGALGSVQPSDFCLRVGATCNPRFKCCPGLACTGTSVRPICLAAEGCTAPGNPGVTICKPANGSSVSSPIAVQAKGRVIGTIARMDLWVDGVKRYTAARSGSLNTSVSLAAGRHRFAVLAVNTAGTKWETVVYATVH